MSINENLNFMRKAIFFIGILFVSISAKSQIWEPGLAKTMQKYYIIPVEFKSFGEWISGIENDSTIRFKKKEMILENDSIYLNFDFEKSGISSPFENSRLSAKIFGRTSNFENLSTIKSTSNSISIVPFPSKKETTIQIIAIITFDSTNEGKLLSANVQQMLEDEFAVFFVKKINNKKKYNGFTRRYHPEVVRSVGFTQRKNVSSGFNILNSSFPDRNEVSLSLFYELKDKNIENKN